MESATVAPRQLLHYGGETDVLVLAIRLGFSLVRNHGFNDGNKRTAAAAMIEFLAVNGYDLFVPDDDAVEPLLGRWIERLTSGDYDERQVYDRLKHFLQPAA